MTYLYDEPDQVVFMDTAVLRATGASQERARGPHST